MCSHTHGPMNTKDAAHYIGFSASKLEKMRVEGRGPRYLKVGGAVRYRAADLDAYLDSCVVETEQSRGPR